MFLYFEEEIELCRVKCLSQHKGIPQELSPSPVALPLGLEVSITGLVIWSSLSLSHMPSIDVSMSPCILVDGLSYVVVFFGHVVHRGNTFLTV